MQHDLIIGYSRHDLAAVQPIKEELESLGFCCRVVRRRGTVDRTVLTVLLFFLSKSSQKSERLLRLIQLAKKERKPVFVIRFTDDPVAESFAGAIKGLEIVDWRVAEQRKRLVENLKSSIAEDEKRSMRIPCCVYYSRATPDEMARRMPYEMNFLADVDRMPDLCCESPPPDEMVACNIVYEKSLPARHGLFHCLNRFVATFGVAGPPGAGTDLGIGVVAPETVPRGDEMMVQIVVERYEGLSAAIEKAKSLDAGNQAVERGSLPVRGVRTGAEMAFRFEAGDLRLDDADRVQKRIFDGMPFTLQFFVSVPNGIRKGAHAAKVLVAVDGIPVGRIGFVIKVVDEVGAVRGTAETASRGYREYFASYSDRDLDRVVPRIQGLCSGGRDIHVFFDKLSLRSGDRYEKEIFEYIDDKADAFLLFWSANSAVSEWVEKEWRRALARQKTNGGIPEIFPVPLDRNGPPPPPELSDLHFNDSLLFVCGGQGAGA